MEITGDPPPLWPQLTNPMPRRRSPSHIFTPPVLIILLPIIALLLLFFVIPPFLSITTQIFRPNGVRKSWDSLNIFLVLFAILCGVFARRNDDDDNNNITTNNNHIRNDSNNNKPSHPVTQQWFEYPERKIYDDPPINATSLATSVRRLKRSSSSYPDLRQDSLWENTEDRFRFFDDFEINKYRSSTNYNDQVHELRRNWRSECEESEAKVIPVDTFVLRSSPSSPPSKSPEPSTPPPPPPPPPTARHKSRRYQAVGQKEKVMTQNDHVEFNKIKSLQPVTTPPAPPPPPRRPPSPLVQMGNRSEQKYANLERRKSNATKEIKMVFASLRNRMKKQKSKDHDHRQVCPLHSTPEPPPYYSTTIPPPPPPPLPPPPSSVFQKYNLFRKGSKTKKFHSVPAPPPPPPPAFSLSKRSSKQNSQIPPTPPPQPPPAFFSTKRLSKQKSQIPPTPPLPKPPPAPSTPPPEPSRRQTTANRGRPPLPTKENTSYYDENVNSGGQSPLIPMPPPPPPFKMPEFKFVVRGDFVKIQSSPSSRCSSPDLEEVDVSLSKDDVETASLVGGDDGVGVGVGVEGVPVFCPSPDVNAKAETFIARHRDGWKLEKMNSVKEKPRI
ncbi:hypothetical protein CRYUN_Cryun03dG0015800 [Craigia yunnanensis]